VPILLSPGGVFYMIAITANNVVEIVQRMWPEAPRLIHFADRVLLPGAPPKVKPGEAAGVVAAAAEAAGALAPKLRVGALPAVAAAALPPKLRVGALPPKLNPGAEAGGGVAAGAAAVGVPKLKAGALPGVVPPKLKAGALAAGATAAAAGAPKPAAAGAEPKLKAGVDAAPNDGVDAAPNAVVAALVPPRLNAPAAGAPPKLKPGAAVLAAGAPNDGAAAAGAAAPNDRVGADAPNPGVEAPNTEGVDAPAEEPPAQPGRSIVNTSHQVTQ
jgi:hypothetical protein